MSDHLRCRVMAAVRVGMLGMVKPHLRRVSVAWDEKSISLRAVYDENFTSGDIEDISILETELIADFWPDLEVSCRAETIPARKKVVCDQSEVLVFDRFEARDYTE